VRISVDDFGTGYSSLAYLKRLPLDEIKIDRSFLADVVSNRDDAAIVRSTIDLAHNLGLQVVGEGVENAETWGLLAQHGCDLLQGYYVSPALPAAELVAWLREWRRTPAIASSAG
jgi:EAL domain-containing protein (putative c-di-GMP-specific phosphodiesterase class I)